MSAAIQSPAAALPPKLGRLRIRPVNFVSPAGENEAAAALAPPAGEPPAESSATADVDAAGSQPKLLLTTHHSPLTPSPTADAPRLKAKRHYNRVTDSNERVAGMEKLLPHKVPRLRDIRIYESVVFEKLSQYDVAEVFGISQPRVCQIVQEVRAWKATVPWEFEGMTDEQQINLATHETRRWLEIIRDKCLEKADATDCGNNRLVYDKNGQQVRKEVNQRSQVPKPGFMAIAFQAVVKAGQLGGAGEQWRQRRVQSAECGVEREEMSKDEIQMTKECRNPNDEMGSSRSPVPSSELEVPDADNAGCNTGNCEPAEPNPEPRTLNPLPHLLKENPPAFSPVNGKANGHASSALRQAAQVQMRRRQKNRQIAYQAAAERQGVGPASRSNFFQMLRQLEAVSDRVERVVALDLQRDTKHGIIRSDDELRHIVESGRRYHLERLLGLSRHVRLHPYGMPWVWEQYDLRRGRFRWDLEEGGNDE